MLYFIDLFCGAGGVSEGITNARDAQNNPVAKVIYCVNHDETAIKSHAANHPNCIHAVEDIRTHEVQKIVDVVQEIRDNDHEAIVVLWASIDCTQHSRAKGNLPKKADSRTLAWDLYPYFDQINPDLICIENVREFMKWGEIDENGYIIKGKESIYYDAWVESLQERGYKYQYRVLNAADFGAYQSRERLFIIFDKIQNENIEFPKPTHSKFGSANLAKWKPVKEVLDLHIEGESIFHRKRELSENTKRRILFGLKKQILQGEKAFVQNYYSSQYDNSSSINEPSRTLTTIPHQAIVKSTTIEDTFVVKWMGNNLKTGANNGCSVNDPSITITTQNRLGLCKADFMLRYNGNDTNLISMGSPSPTILTKDTVAKIGIDYFLLNPQWGNQSRSIELPCFTLIARMDKTPPYLVQTERGDLAIEVYETDSPMTKELKKVMAENGIIDLKLRMFRIPELMRIQGFRDNYILFGTKEQQKKHIGNAVHTVMAQRMVESIAESLTTVVDECPQPV